VTQALFRLQAIAFAYEPQRPVLAGVDLSLESGERLAIIGANGSGKTTLLHLMVGLLKPSAGQLWAFGRERRAERDFHEVRVRAGLLFQDPDDQLFCPTVLEDVAFGPLNLGKTPAAARAMAEATLESIGLAGFGSRITHRLSGGEKRLVTLATVLAMQPDVLLLDEPTAGLDDEAEARLLALLQARRETMVLVSHDRDFRKRLASRVVTLRGGRIENAADGTSQGVSAPIAAAPPARRGR
jgi:cobalt/nickel transport system ATP-binding protein